MSKETISVEGKTYYSPKAIVKMVSGIVASALGVERIRKPAVTETDAAAETASVQSAPAPVATTRRRGRPARVRHIEAPVAHSNGANE